VVACVPRSDLDTGCQELPLLLTSRRRLRVDATTEIHPDSTAAAVACRRRSSLDASDQEPPRLPASLAAVSTSPPSARRDACHREPPRRLATFAAVSTPAAENRSGGLPPSPRSRCRRRGTAVAAYLSRLGRHDQDLPLWPAAVAAVSTQATKILVRRCSSPESPPPRRLRLRPAAVARRLRCGREACRREPPRWPAALASIFKANFEIDIS